MTFLNGLLAFGAAAFAVPLIIHLLHRSKFQTVEWGAMHLLQASQNANSRRMQWQQLLLLLLRCLLPILLALAMSRPLFQSWLTDDRGTPQSIAFLMDDSLSMFAQDQAAGEQDAPVREPLTRWQSACDAIETIVQKLPRGSDVAIVLAGEKCRLLESHAPDDVVRQIRSLKERKRPAGTLDVDSGVRESLQWLSQSNMAKRQLVIVSDWQQSDWTSDGLDKGKGLLDLVKKQPVAPEVAFLNVVSKPNSNDAGPIQNLLVESIVASPMAIAIDRDTSVLTTIANGSNSASESVMVAVYVDDLEIDRQEVTVAKQSSLQVRSRWSPKTAGVHIVRASILKPDANNSDNSKSLIAEVNSPLPVLLVDGDIQSAAMQSETDFIKLALSPFSLLQSEKGDLFKTKTIQPQELNRAQLTNVNAVVLCNVPELNGDQQSMLREFVDAGGGLIVVLGDKVRVEHYNSWPTLSDKGLRMATLAPRTGVSVDQIGRAGSPNGEGTVDSRVKLQIASVQREPLNELSTISLASLEKTVFSFRTPMTLVTGLDEAPYHGSVSFRFDDEQPWMIQASVGKGKCFWIATGLDDDDSNIPSRPAFLPLVQKIVGYVANVASVQRPLGAGDAWDLGEVTRRSRLAANDGKQPRWSVTRPDGTIISIDKAESNEAVFQDTRMLGTYLYRESPASETADANPDRPSAAPKLLSAIEVGPSQSVVNESASATPASEELNAIAKNWEATVSMSAQEFERRGTSSWHGKEIWTWLWIALVIVFMSEIAVQQFQSPRLQVKSSASQGSAVGMGVT